MREKRILLIIPFSILLLFFHLNASQTESQNLLVQGKEKFRNGEFNEAINILNNALITTLSADEKIEAHLYLGVCCIALNKTDEGESHFKEIIKINPDYIFKEGVFPPEIKNIFKDVKNQFPIIYDFKSLPKEFSPYRGEKAYFNFKISSPDCLNLSISNNNKSILKDRKCFETSGNQNFVWIWNDELINLNEFNVHLEPDKNKNEYAFLEKIKIKVKLPEELLYINGKFQYKEFHFLPETEEKKTFPNLVLFTGLSVLSGYGAYHFLTTEPEQDLYYQEENPKTKYIATGVLCGLFAVYSLIKALTPKKKEVTIKKNIKKNEELKERIERSKEKIKVKQEIKHLSLLPIPIL